MPTVALSAKILKVLLEMEYIINEKLAFMTAKYLLSHDMGAIIRATSVNAHD